MSPRDEAGSETPLRARVGLCAECRESQRQAGKRGSEFWRCLRADRDSRFLRYPPLPVRVCPGFAVRSDGRGDRLKPRS